jgi:hypothetical protein
MILRRRFSPQRRDAAQVLSHIRGRSIGGRFAAKIYTFDRWRWAESLARLDAAGHRLSRVCGIVPDEPSIRGGWIIDIEPPPLEHRTLRGRLSRAGLRQYALERARAKDAHRDDYVSGYPGDPERPEREFACMWAATHPWHRRACHFARYLAATQRRRVRWCAR